MNTIHRAAASALALLAATPGLHARLLSVEVVDQATGRPLHGAVVRVGDRIEPAASSGRATFDMPDSVEIAVGASMMGFLPDSAVLAAGAGDTLLRIELVDHSVKDMGVKVVKGQRRGAAEALSRQKNAINAVSIVVADVIGKLPDQNPAEAAARVPGATLARDQGEGRYVSLRGTAPRLTHVRLDGVALPSPEGDIRTPAIDVLPADQLAAIEVHKSLLPEMDGDGIGGAVDLRTRIAPTRGSRLKGSIGGGWNNEAETAENVQGGASWEARTADGATGWSLAASGMRRRFGSDNAEAEWGSNELDDESGEVFGLQSLELRDYSITRDRMAACAAVEHRIGLADRLWTRLSWNRYGDDEIRQSRTSDLADGDQTAPGTWEDATSEISLKDRNEVQDIGLATVGGEHLFPRLGDSRLSWTLNAHYAREVEDDRFDATFVQEGVSMTGPTGASDRPEVSYGPGAGDASAHVLDEVVRQDNETSENDYVGSLDWALPLRAGSAGFELKAGTKASFRIKRRENDVRVYSWEGEDDPPTLDQVDGGIPDNDFLDGDYLLGPSIDPERARDLAASLESSGDLVVDENDSRLESDPANYRSQENVLAGYGQLRTNWGPMVAIAGARWEQTWNRARGNIVEIDDEGDYAGTRATRIYRVDGRLLPRFTLRVEPVDNIVLRAAATRSLARPDHYDLVPYRIVNREDGEIELGNPDLQITDAWNYDASVEAYFNNVGMASIGLFHKRIEDQIYVRTFESSYDGSDWEWTQPRNADESEVSGIELAVQQQLTFLPGPLAGLGLQGSATFVASEAKISGRDDKLPNPGQSDRSARAALSYEWAGFQSRVAWTWQDAMLDEVGGAPEEDRWMDEQSHVDLSASQRIWKGWRIWGEAWNLTDAPLRYTWGKNGPFSQQEYYGPTFWLGVKYEG